MLTNFFLPYFNSFTHKEMTLGFDMQSLITIVPLFLAVFLIAGSYPAMYLSSFSPMMIFKGANITGGKTGFIRIVVVLQFFFSICLIICTLVVFKQLSYMANKDLGIDKENIITARCGLWYDVDEFKQEVLRNPNVLAAGMSLLTPESFSFEMKNVSWEGKTMQDTMRMNMAMIDGDFAKTYGLQVVHGELLKTSGEDYWSGKGGGVMINESAARVLGFENPIGQTINGQKIVAVVRDFHFRPLKEPVVPLILSYSQEALVNISFKLSPANQKETISFIKETYESMRPGTAFEYRFFKDQIAERYQAENKLGKLFLLITFLSLSISCLGILGLTAINTGQRTKEIGLRKITGASVMNIMLLLNKKYIRWIAVAFIVAVPFAAFLMNRWLQAFAYHTPLSWWIFLLSGLITLIVAIAANSWLCYKAARQNPINLLRYE
jgi:putative ABC transport system permease protein